MRWRITYPSCSKDHGTDIELPFVIAVIGDFADGAPQKPLSERRFTTILDTTKTSSQCGPPCHAHPGLRHLVRSCATAPAVTIRFLHATKQELLDDAIGSPETSRSHLYRAIVQDSSGMFGYYPCSVVLVDHEFSPAPLDIKLLQLLAVIGRAAHVPILASPNVDFVPADVAGPRDPTEVCNQLYQASNATDRFWHWQQLRQHPAAQYLFLVTPPVCLCQEDCEPSPTCKDRPQGNRVGCATPTTWTSPVYCIASRLVIAHDLYGWPATLAPERHEELGLSVCLPISRYDDRVVRLPPLRWAPALASCGFVPIVGRRSSSLAIIPSCRSVAQIAEKAEAKSPELDCQLLSLSTICRFAHCVRVMRRESEALQSSRPEVFFEAVLSWLDRCASATVDSDGTPPPFFAGHARLEQNGEDGFGVRLSILPNYLSAKATRPVELEIRFGPTEKRIQSHAAAAHGGAEFHV